MKVVCAILFCLFVALQAYGEDPQKAATPAADDQTQKTGYKESVEVNAKTYPSLEFEIGTPIDLVRNYRPANIGQISAEYYRPMVYRPSPYKLTLTANPAQSGQLIDFSVVQH